MRCSSFILQTRIRGLLAFLAIAGSSICLAADPRPATVPASQPAALDLVDLQTLGGFTGRGNGEGVTVRSDGTITCWSAHHVEHAGHLTDSELTDLRKLLTAVNWDALAKSYNPGHIADGYEDHLSATIAGKKHLVIIQHKIDPAALPADLRSVWTDLGKLMEKYSATKGETGSK